MTDPDDHPVSVPAQVLRLAVPLMERAAESLDRSTKLGFKDEPEWITENKERNARVASELRSAITSIHIGMDEAGLVLVDRDVSLGQPNHPGDWNDPRSPLEAEAEAQEAGR